MISRSEGKKHVETNVFTKIMDGCVSDDEVTQYEQLSMETKIWMMGIRDYCSG